MEIYKPTKEDLISVGFKETIDGYFVYEGKLGKGFYNKKDNGFTIIEGTYFGIDLGSEYIFLNREDFIDFFNKQPYEYSIKR